MKAGAEIALDINNTREKSMERRQTEAFGKYIIAKVTSKGRQKKLQRTGCGIALRRQDINQMEGTWRGATQNCV